MHLFHAALVSFAERREIIMAIIEIDGFKFLDDTTERIIVVETNRIDECVDYINANGINSVYLCDLWYNKKDIEFLQRIAFIDNLNISCPNIQDYDGLKCLSGLKKLIIGDVKSKLDLKNNLMLNELSIEMDKNILGLNELNNLKILRLWKYTPKSKSLIELSNLTSLKSLKISDSSIESFEGCEKLNKLEKLELSYLKKMCCIDELEKIKDTLKVLEFNSCKKITNHDYVSCLSNLEKLAFNRCSDIESISFINDLKKLKSFIFMETNICDGDLGACKDLEYVAFVNKKHYSHKLQDFRQ